jgi:imidazolonepropionase
MKSVLIKNIAGLVHSKTPISKALRGEALKQIDLLENAYLMIEDGIISDYGSMDSIPERADEEIDANGGFVLPAFCDSHTHLVFAAPREQEFVYRIQGMSYQEIAERGGGILNSARRLQAMEEEALFDASQKRLFEVIKTGTGAIEIKSGYGLTLEAELKMLRVIKRLKEISPIPVKSSFLGAHAMPMEFRENREAYLSVIINEMLPRIADQGLADYIDVFCEKGFYSVEELDRILEAGAKYGLIPKIHTNQFNSMGGIETAIKYKALSVDHLEVLNEDEIRILSQGNTIATLLPSAPFFLNDEHFPPARKMVDAGIPISLASDYNPGTSPSGNMSFVLTLACIKLRLLPEEAINAATVNAAFALGLEKELGTIQVGKKANLILTKPIPSLAYLPYSFGSSCIEKVIVGKDFF